MNFIQVLETNCGDKSLNHELVTLLTSKQVRLISNLFPNYISELRDYMIGASLNLFVKVV